MQAGLDTWVEDRGDGSRTERRGRREGFWAWIDFFFFFFSALMPFPIHRGGMRSRRSRNRELGAQKKQAGSLK